MADSLVRKIRATVTVSGGTATGDSYVSQLNVQGYGPMSPNIAAASSTSSLWTTATYGSTTFVHARAGVTLVAGDTRDFDLDLSADPRYPIYPSFSATVNADNALVGKVRFDLIDSFGELVGGVSPASGGSTFVVSGRPPATNCTDLGTLSTSLVHSIAPISVNPGTYQRNCPEYWYTFVAPANGSVLCSTMASDGNAAIDGTFVNVCDNSGNIVACDVLGHTGLSVLTAPVLAGQRYYVGSTLPVTGLAATAGWGLLRALNSGYIRTNMAVDLTFTAGAPGPSTFWTKYAGAHGVA